MFKLPELKYKYNELEPHIDTVTMETHHTKHHQTYVNKLNEALEKYPEFKEKDLDVLLKNLNNIPEDIRTAVKNHGGGNYNHTFFWKLLNPKPGQVINENLEKNLIKVFGSVDSFKNSFTQKAATLFGSGWVWLVTDSKNNLEILATPNQDTPLSAGKTPLIGIDVWEHAYYLKYKNKRPDYIKAWWNVVDWNYVNEIYTKTT